MTNRKFVCYFHFTGFYDLSLGVHVSISQPNIELHIPFGFFRLGWKKGVECLKPFDYYTFGIGI